MFLPWDTKFEVKFPWYFYATGATCAFIYQTLDAIDGKQARRTGSSSPLGQLFDHGCDGLSLFIGLNIFLFALRPGPDSYLVPMIFWSITTTFYTQQWEEYHTHILRTFIGYFGVTEGLLLQIATMYVIAFTDGAFNELQLHHLIPFLPAFIGHIHICTIGIWFVFLNAVQYSFLNVKEGLEKTKEPKSEALMGLLPLLLFYMSMYITFSTTWGH